MIEYKYLNMFRIPSLLFCLLIVFGLAGHAQSITSGERMGSQLDTFVKHNSITEIEADIYKSTLAGDKSFSISFGLSGNFFGRSLIMVFTTIT